MRDHEGKVIGIVSPAAKEDVIREQKKTPVPSTDSIYGDPLAPSTPNRERTIAEERTLAEDCLHGSTSSQTMVVKQSSSPLAGNSHTPSDSFSQRKQHYQEDQDQHQYYNEFAAEATNYHSQTGFAFNGTPAPHPALRAHVYNNQM